MRQRTSGLLLLFGIMWMSWAPSAAAEDPFGECAEDGVHNATIVVPENVRVTRNGSPISFGSRIAAFTPDGVCIGSTVWNGSATAFSAWADDPMNPVKDGADVGDALVFRIWDVDTQRQYDADVELANGISLDGSNGDFTADAVYVLHSLNVQPGVPQNDGHPESLQIQLSESYPNPFSAEATIPFEVDEPQPVALDVFSATGARVATLVDGAVLSGYQEVRWSPENLPAGLYVIRLRVGDSVRTGSIIHVD